MSRNIKDLGKKLTLGENLNAFDRKSVYNQKLKISCWKIETYNWNLTFSSKFESFLNKNRRFWSRFKGFR